MIDLLYNDEEMDFDCDEFCFEGSDDYDNFFTGIDLMLNLLRCGTYSCGTMRSDMKGFPTALKPLVK